MDADEEGSDREGEATAADGDAVSGMDEAVLYTVVRSAVEDAILGAVGSILLAGLALALAWAGVVVALGSSSVTSATLGAILVAVGGYVAARTLELVPPIGEWGE